MINFMALFVIDLMCDWKPYQLSLMLWSRQDLKANGIEYTNLHCLLLSVYHLTKLIE